LLEAAPDLGGKLAGWPAEVLGETVPMEHGFHGFFSQYYNLRDLLARAGADRDLVPQPSYTVLFADGREEPFAAGMLPFPLDLLEVLGRSPSLGFADVAGDRPGMNALLAYDPERTFARWDGLDAETFVKEGVLEGPFADLVLRPFGQASMNALEGFSAAELVRFFHFYMLGNPEGLRFEVLGRGVHLAVLEPLRAHLALLGVDIRTSTPVNAVVFGEDGRARGVRTGASAGTPCAVPVEALGADWQACGTAFVRRTSSGVEALDGRCTHMGCPVRVSHDGFACPCHGGRFDADGRPTQAPPESPLRPLSVRVEDGVATVDTGPVEESVVEADAVVLAMEVRGLRGLAPSLEAHAPHLARAARLEGEAEPYAVVRFWLDKPVDPARTAFYTVAGYTWTDSIATYSHFQQPYVDWAERTGGSVVECHAYAIPPELQGPVETYRDALLAELRRAFPELAEARVLHVEAMAQSNFTRFAPGDHATRPEVVTEVENLFVAGDHVRLPFPAFLMEAAATSGRLAANAICAADGVREAPIHTVDLRGPLAGVVDA
ncbi:MAG: FAD-dependent oxidoreductase, partial [Myxococcales bacterium]|nr:FAD-dependent oxidoreductase [Myxococcales bacterium]